MDIVFLREFNVDLVIGIYEWERLAPQTVQLDLDIGLPHSRACVTDRVDDTIDYGKVVTRIRQTLAEKNFSLVEALAEHIAQLLLSEFGAPWARVRVTKLGLIREVKHLGVTIERGAK
ncbi:MAG TPA: dienelactone hydrolase [Betaproteobacteria bacterium]|nr:dienelactone hydrolase [Betaproteobacteria bacterium]